MQLIIIFFVFRCLGPLEFFFFFFFFHFQFLNIGEKKKKKEEDNNGKWMLQMPQNSNSKRYSMRFPERF